MKLANTTVLPHPYFNVITICTSGFLLFWFLWSVFRFIDVIRIRIAILSNRLVSIRGISNYLMTFNEIVSQAHINAIIHTRQAHPPKTIKSLYLPFSIDSVHLIHTGHNNNNPYTVNDKIFELKLWISNYSKVFVFFDFKASRLKDLLKVNSMSRNSTTDPTYQQFISYLTNLSISSSYDTVHKFVDFSICREIYQVGSIVEGVHDIRFSLPKFACEVEACQIGIIILSENIIQFTTKKQRKSRDSMDISNLNNHNNNIVINNNNNSNSGNNSNHHSNHGSNGHNNQYVVPIHDNSGDTNSQDIEAQNLTPEYLNPLTNKLSSSSSYLASRSTSRDRNLGITVLKGGTEKRNHSGNSSSSSGGFISENLGFALCVLSGSTLTPPISQQESTNRSNRNIDIIASLPPVSMNSSFHSGSALSSPNKAFRINHNNSNSIINNGIKTNFNLTECFISTRNGVIYSAQEIFGWKGSRSDLSEARKSTSETTSATIDSNCNDDDDDDVLVEGRVPQSNSRHNNHNGSNNYLNGNNNINNSTTTNGQVDTSSFDEECVVCLTEKKDIALLPCRHLCVCRHCLVHIDKCPVCRASFDEYVAISAQDKVTVQIPFHKKNT